MKIRKCDAVPGSQGLLQVNVVSAANHFPISQATVSIAETEEPDQTLEEVGTNASGQTPEISLPAPPLEYSMEPGEPRPYSEYTLRVTAPGFEPVLITGTEILPDVLALQPVQLRPLDMGPSPSDDVLIPDHTLYGEYPPKIAEPEIKPVGESGEIVLSRVVVPETIVVHDGAPTNSSAPNYYVPYKDYIKNVASSEIYATWPQSTITANVLAILSFTMNRIYTEWYRNRGYNFTITSSTAYDHKWIYGRNVFEQISQVVDDIFTNYLSRPDVKQPILTQYCDGKRVSCPNWLSQWGSKALGDKGYSPIEILRNYYGNNMYINTAEIVSGIPSSWPGQDLTRGSRGDAVRQLQEQLNAIASVYTAIPSLAADGIFGPATEASVREFQSIFGLPESGVVDYRTWYKVSELYVAITRMAELS
ncbi:MAG: peptidoglycan-binding protein [Lachnospiraceae bacterium]|nr:peptidoglycan-binding protein [Lachnospiraceae bacterium]